MMAHLVYVGASDAREFSARDVQSLGVEGGAKLRFDRGVPVEVDESLSKLLLEDGQFSGDFKLEENVPARQLVRSSEETADSGHTGRGTTTGASESSTGTSAAGRTGKTSGSSRTST
jgi:hypothetical protein